MSELFGAYKGGAFGNVLPSIMNAAMQQRPAKMPGMGIFGVKAHDPLMRRESSGAVATSGAARQDRMAPHNYTKFKEQTLGATLASINELRNETETETVQIPIETMPAGGMVEAEKYYSLDQNARDLTEMITGLEQESAVLEKGIEALETESEKEPPGRLPGPMDHLGITPSQRDPNAPDPVEQRKLWVDSFNNAQQQKMEAEGTLASVRLLQEKNLEAGGGPIETEVHEAYREVPTDNASKRDAAMKMVAEVAGKVGGQAAATLYQEVDRLYPTTRTATTHVDDQGKPIGWQPSGMNTLVQARGQGQFPAELFGKMEIAGATYNPATGSTSYQMKPLESRETLVKFPGAAKPMYANTKENAAMINETLSQFDPLMMGIDKLLEIAKSGKTFKKLDPVTRRDASIIQATLIGNIRTQIVGPGVVSNFDYQQLLKAVNNPTTIFDVEMIFGGDQVSISALQTLQTAMYNALLAKAGMSGFTGGGEYKIPKQYRRFNSVEDARRLGFQSGDIVNILGADPRKPNEYAPGKLD